MLLIYLYVAYICMFTAYVIWYMENDVYVYIHYLKMYDMYMTYRRLDNI